MSGQRMRRVVILSAVLCLLAFLIGKAAFDWRLHQLDERIQQSLEGQTNAAQGQAHEPRNYPLPDDLVRALMKPSDFHVYRSLDNVSGSVRSAFAKAAGEESFSMAEPNGRWEATDVIRDPQLPRRRLSSIALGGELCLLFYEHGGIARNDNIAVFRIARDHAEPIWHAYVARKVRDPNALAKALQEAKYDESPFF